MTSPNLKTIATSGSDARSGATSFGRVAIEGRVDVSHGVILYLEDVSVSFDGFKALDALSLAIDDGELRCVIGPNGAGKTTMMDVITGKTRPDAGTVFFGQSIDLTRLSASPRSRRRASAASSRSRRCSSSTRCGRTWSSR